MGLLHDKLKSSGYVGHALEVYLVRLVFCLFAEHTGIFEMNQFQNLIEQRTAEDGQDLAQWLANCFEVLNTPHENRLTHLDPQLAAFRYINGQLFAEHLPTAAFDREMRNLLLEGCALDWGRISPAIFGALFQAVMDTKNRRHLGAHYTSETNILKLIKPLFLDELRAEFERVKRQSKTNLFAFQEKLASLKFLDPACGCGNFLVIVYRELRLLELEVLRALFGASKDLSIGVGEFNILCNVNQFYGIEIEEFPAQIAQTALWLTDHQMNQVASQEFGKNYLRIPLTHSATIRHGNALQIDWRELVPPSGLNYILGNPPFVGSKYMSDSQRAEVASIFHAVKGAGILDFVSAWYRQATDYMTDNPEIKTAFVATNSITQGEQVGVLWSDLLKRGVKIHFAHRTFQWSSEAKGKAAVHCVIIGFAVRDVANKSLFDYETAQSEATETKVKNNINPYLINAADIVVNKRSKPICDVPEMCFGNQPIDDGNFIFSAAEKKQFLTENPTAEQFLRLFLGAEEFLNGGERWCLWLKDAKPEELHRFPTIMRRLELIRKFRLSSKRLVTRQLAATPNLFAFISHPDSDYLVIPRVSSERRHYIPLGFVDSQTVVSDAALIVPHATLYHFGVLTSAMHMAWMRTVCGRLKSDYRYSASIVYNNFPWPEKITGQQRNTIGQAAQAVLDARAQAPNASLAALYDPLTMPVELVKAHRQVDAAVDAVYSKQKFSGDAERVAFLFERYQQLTAPLAPQKPQRRKRV
ncbi:hypothetical protein CKO12_08870 [Chromatium okenii]|nr:hypothetical protein [Chromatium okenii]